MKTLIVEDNPDDRLMLKTNLEAHNCVVIEAADGIEGLELAKKHKPALIISDALMPRMDGFQLLRKVRQDEELKAIPFVFYSSTYTGEREVELAMSLGADAYIFKPKEPKEFWEEILKILEKCALKKDRLHKKNILHDEEFLRRYTDVVTTKLEEKIKELEKEKDCAEESRRQYKKLFDSSLDGIYSTDESDRFVQTNSAFAKIFGYDRPEELIGRSVFDLWIDIEDRNRYLQELKEKKGLSAYPVRARKKNGDKLYIEISSNILEDENGRFMGIEGIVRDMTGHEKLEEQLRQAQKMEAVGTLAGGIAHDFNNILSAIIGYGSLTLMKMEADDPLRNNIDQILEASQRAAVLTQSLLAFSRKQAINLTLFDLNDLLGRFEKFILRILREDIELKLICADHPLPVLADSGQMEQVLMNLATNARDAMLGGGRLVIETRPVVFDEESVQSHEYVRAGRYALISVSDTGAGMNEKTKEKIFEPFFTTKEVGKGTGLGLAMTYGIVKKHEGYINVYSELGHGTTFNVYLPMAETAVEEEEKEAAEPAPLRGGTETVLVAEDDLALRRLAVTVLGHYGYDVIEAEDGEDAVKKFIENKDRVHLVILDGIMPKKNGKETYDEIMLLKPDTRVIFMSGYSEDIFSSKDLAEKGVTYLLKPVAPSVLLQTIRAELDK